MIETHGGDDDDDGDGNGVAATKLICDTRTRGFSCGILNKRLLPYVDHL